MQLDILLMFFNFVDQLVPAHVIIRTKEITGDGTNFEALGYGSNIPNFVYVEATEAIPRTTTVYST